jgi:hypothetical protein
MHRLHRNYDWWDVAVSAGVGAIAPGWGSVGKSTWKSGAAIKTLSSQLARARTANRAAKIAARIGSHKENISNIFINQVIQGAVKPILKSANN